MADLLARKQARGQKSFNLKIIQPSNNDGEGHRVLSSPTDMILSPITKELRKRIKFDYNRYTIESIAATDSPCEGLTELILGSSSANRRAILNKLHWSHELISPNIDKKSIRTEDPLDLPGKIAIAKAAAVMSKLRTAQHPRRCIVITADQVVIFQGSVRRKPESREEAVHFLSSYNSNTVRTVSAITVTEYPSGVQKTGSDVASVQWGTISNDTVQKVVEKGEVFTAAGGFRIDDPDLSPLVTHTEGTVDSIMGLPVNLTKCLIEDVLTFTAGQAQARGNEDDGGMDVGQYSSSLDDSMHNGSNSGSTKSYDSHDSLSNELATT